MQTKAHDVFVPPAMSGGPLRTPLYLTLGDTDPATLAYASQAPACVKE